MNVGILPEDTVLGPLEIIEVLGYYDGPYLLSCRNQAGHVFLALEVDEDEGADVWLYVPVSPERLEFVRTGGLTLHDAFATPEGGITYRVAVPFEPGPAQIELLPASQVPEELLPDAAERLDLKAIPKAEVLAADVLARRINRDVVDLYLRLEGRNRPEAPSAAVGRFLGAFQRFADAIGEAHARRILKKGQKLDLEKLKGDTEFVLAETVPGSLGVRLYASHERDLFQEGLSKEILDEFMALTDSTADYEQLVARLGEMVGAPATHYEEFLGCFSDLDGEMAVKWGRPDVEAPRVSSVLAATAKDALERVQKREDAESTEFIIRCLAVGIHDRLLNFEVQDLDTGKAYSGKISKEAKTETQHATINDVYGATLRETRQVAPGHKPKYKHELIHLEREED